MSVITPAADESVAEPVKAIEGRSPGRLAWDRLRRDRATQIAGVVMAVFIILAILAPIMNSLGWIDPYTGHPNLLNPNNGSLPLGSVSGASGSHWLGVSPLIGQDNLSRALLGITYTLTIALGATVISVVLGAVIGMVSGFMGGWVDTIVGRLIDLVLCFPQTLMLIALSGTFTALLTDTFKIPAGNMANWTYVVLVLGIFGWPGFARVIRGQVLSLRNGEFVEAARSLGSSRWRIYGKELLPNLWAPILVYTSLFLPQYVSAEAALAFLGVGIKPPTPTLGNILNASVTYTQSDLTFFLIPALTILVMVLAFNLVGDGVRDALDPRTDR